MLEEDPPAESAIPPAVPENTEETESARRYNAYALTAVEILNDSDLQQLLLDVKRVPMDDDAMKKAVAKIVKNAVARAPAGSIGTEDLQERFVAELTMTLKDLPHVYITDVTSTGVA